MSNRLRKPPPAPPNIAADKLATWVFAELTKGVGGEYPLLNVQMDLQPNGQGVLLPVQLNVPAPKNAPNSKPISEPVKIQRELKAISAKLRKDANFVTRYYSRSIAADDLGDAIGRLTNLLVDLAEKDATALHRLCGSTIASVIELEKMSFREDSLRMIQAEASKQSLWPVPYSPHPRRKRELDKTMRKIKLGEHNFQKLWGARDTDKSVAGKFARRMGSTLWIIYAVPGLRFFLSQQAVGMDVAQREKHLLAQDWHLWMIRLCQLPELTKASAPAWFEIGWEALQDVTGGNVLSIPELAKLGKTNAAYGESIGLKSGAQNCRAKEQIRKLLRKAFLARFGNPA